MVESEEGAAEAADDGGLDGGAGEGVEAEVEEGSAAAAAVASGCEGGGASMLFDELPGRSAGAELVYCLKKYTKLQVSARTCLQNLVSTRRTAAACLRSPDTNRLSPVHELTQQVTENKQLSVFTPTPTL
jgi:hypothetical protein